MPVDAMAMDRKVGVEEGQQGSVGCGGGGCRS